jgi:hypothetical protein
MQQEVEFGTYTVLAGLGCAPPFSRGTFQWEHRFEVIEWQFHYLNDLDPFDVPGVAVIQPPDMPQMLQHPKPTYSIPAEYVGILQDEQAFNRAHPSWTEAVAAEPGLAFAKAQLKSGNPLVVMEATRALSAAGKLDREAAAGLVKEGPGMWQALNAVAILCGMTKEGEASLGQAIVDAIDGAKNLEDLKALFIGATVAYSTAWDEQEKAVQVRPPMYVVSRTTPLPLNGTAPYLQAVFKHAVDRRHAMKARTPANQYMELLEGREKWAYDQALDHTMELAASSPGQPEGSAAATGAPAAQNPAATAPVPADTGVTNPQQGTGGATTPAEDSTLPPLILSKEDQTRIDELGKMTGKPLTYDQKVAVVKALRDYRSMLKAARSVFDDHAAKVLSMTIDELHTRERKFRHDEAEQKKEQESAGTAAAP